MSVTPPRELAGILPVVISGNRPRLDHRVTHRLLAPLHGVTADPVWLVRDEFAPAYERDAHEIVTYSRAEADEYAAAHWMGPDLYAPGAFLGCFTEREWACRLAEARGHWAVLMLDDNIRSLTLFAGYAAAIHVAAEQGGLALFADILAAVTLSTNSAMTGAKLQAVDPITEAGTFARAGFPYSLFLERTGPGREEYFGPIEEDILHAYQYGANASPSCAALVYPLEYMKEHNKSAGTGMRPHYADGRRSVALQRMAPEMAGIRVNATHSNGRGEPRIFHKMSGHSVRTPLVVTDPALYEAAGRRCVDLAAEITPRMRAAAVARADRRARQASWRAGVRALMSAPLASAVVLPPAPDADEGHGVPEDVGRPPFDGDADAGKLPRDH